MIPLVLNHRIVRALVIVAYCLVAASSAQAAMVDLKAELNALPSVPSGFV